MHCVCVSVYYMYMYYMYIHMYICVHVCACLCTLYFIFLFSPSILPSLTSSHWMLSILLKAYAKWGVLMAPGGYTSY